MNRIKAEPYALRVENALERLSTNQNANIDSFGQQENDEINDTLNENLHNEEFLDDELTCNFPESGFSCSTHPVFQDSLINENIRSLNVKQRQVFDVIHKWARNYVKNLSSKHVKCINPFHIFLTGGAGVGKSHLIKTIFMSINKLLPFKGGDPENFPRILILAPTGVAAININGTTVYTALGMNVVHKLYPLNDRQSEFCEISFQKSNLLLLMKSLSSVLFHQVHQRLNKIFGVSTYLSFSGLPVLVCGDLYQLPPVKGAPIYSSTDNIKGYVSLELWNNFKVVELTEVMRQRGDLEFISFLNKIRVGIVDYEGEKILLSRFIAKDNLTYLKHALRMIAVNKPSVDYNKLILNEILGEVISINAIDEVPQ